MAAVLFRSDQSMSIWFSSGIELKLGAGVKGCKPPVEAEGGEHAVLIADVVAFPADKVLGAEVGVTDGDAPGRGRSSGGSRVGAS